LYEPLVLVAGTYRIVETIVEPINDFVRYMPVVAFVPLFILWFGTGDSQKLLIIWLGTFPQLLLVIAAASAHVPREYRRRRFNNINTFKAHRSAGGYKDAVWSGFAAFAYQADRDRAGRTRPFARSCGILRDDAVADCDAFITNECRRAGDELSHGALRTVAERATILPPLEEEQQ